MAWLLRKFCDAGLVGRRSRRSQRSLCSYRWRHPLAEVQACGDCAAGRHQIRRLLRDRGKGRGRIRRTDARRRRPADIVGEVGQIAARTGWRLRRDALGMSPDQAGYGFFPKPSLSGLGGGRLSHDAERSEREEVARVQNRTIEFDRFWLQSPRRAIDLRPSSVGHV
jgi:hypothetical protein